VNRSLIWVIEKVVEEDPRYPEKAYLFVLTALNRAIEALPEPRHVTGREVSEECRELALEEFGPFARSVLEHWGISSTADFGEMIYKLLDWGILTKRDEDSKEDFVGVYDFNKVFPCSLLGERSPEEKGGKGEPGHSS